MKRRTGNEKHSGITESTLPFWLFTDYCYDDRRNRDAMGRCKMWKHLCWKREYGGILIFNCSLEREQQLWAITLNDGRVVQPACAASLEINREMVRNVLSKGNHVVFTLFRTVGISTGVLMIRMACFRSPLHLKKSVCCTDMKLNVNL